MTSELTAADRPEPVRRFVFVDGSGNPFAYAAAQQAVQLFRSATGADVYDRTRPEDTLAELARSRELRVFRKISEDHSPITAALFADDGTADLESYTNAHIPPEGRSRDYLEEALAAWSARDGAGPRVGDLCMGADGKRTRFTYDWGEDIQAGGGDGGFFIHRDGIASYSGGLSDAIPKDRLRRTDALLSCRFWFFMDGWTGAHRGISVRLPCRVWSETK